MISHRSAAYLRQPIPSASGTRKFQPSTQVAPASFRMSASTEDLHLRTLRDRVTAKYDKGFGPVQKILREKVSLHTLLVSAGPPTSLGHLLLSKDADASWPRVRVRLHEALWQVIQQPPLSDAALTKLLDWALQAEVLFKWAEFHLGELLIKPSRFGPREIFLWNVAPDLEAYTQILECAGPKSHLLSFIPKSMVLPDAPKAPANSLTVKWHPSLNIPLKRAIYTLYDKFLLKEDLCRLLQNHLGYKLKRPIRDQTSTTTF